MYSQYNPETNNIKPKQKHMAKINSIKEILKNENDKNTNIKRCIVAGYSVHICQYKKEMPEEQEGGGWWPFSFGKGKEDNPNEILPFLTCLSTKGLIIFLETAIFLIHLSDSTDIFIFNI